jgi:hypothetical protein
MVGSCPCRSSTGTGPQAPLETAAVSSVSNSQISGSDTLQDRRCFSACMQPENIWITHVVCVHACFALSPAAGLQGRRGAGAAELGGCRGSSGCTCLSTSLHMPWSGHASFGWGVWPAMACQCSGWRCAAAPMAPAAHGSIPWYLFCTSITCRCMLAATAADEGLVHVCCKGRRS